MKRLTWLALILLVLSCAPVAARAASPQAKATAPDAEKAFAEGRYGEASRLFATAISACRAPAAQPDYCLGLLLLGSSSASAADDPAEAERLSLQALAIAHSVPGGGKEEAALALLTLGNAQVSQGKVADGERSFRQALAAASAAVAKEHPLIAMAQNSLSLLLDGQGKLSEAEALHRSSIATLRATLGVKSPALPTMLAGLADNLAQQARYDDAEKSYGEALTLARELNGPTHPAIAQILSSMAAVKQKRGHFMEAEALLRQAATIDRSALGPTHALVGRDTSNLGALYLDAGRLREAEAEFRAALLISERSGPEHPAVASDLGNLAATLRLQGRSEEATAIARRALAIDQKAFGEISPRVAMHYANIAAHLEDQERYTEAEAYRSRAFEIERKIYGEDTPEITAALANLAANLGRQDRFAEAEPLLRQTLKAQGARFGERSVPTALAESQLGVLLARSGRPAKAVSLFKRALATRQSVLGQNHPDTAGAYHNVATILDQLGRAAEAEAPARRALAIRRAALAPSHPDIAISETLLARILSRSVNGLSEAIKLLRNAMTIARARAQRSFAGSTDVGSVELAQMRAGSSDRAAADPFARTFAAFLRIADERTLDAPQESRSLGPEAFLAAQDLDVSAAGLAMAQTAARAAAGSGALAALVRLQQDLAAQSRLLDARLVGALGAAQQERAAALRFDLNRVGTQLAAAEDQLRRSFPEYGRLIFSGALSVAELRQRLGANEGMLLIRPAGDDVFVFAITSGSFDWRRVKGASKTVASRVELLRCQVDPLTCESKARRPPINFALVENRAFDTGAAHALYAKLLKPIEATFQGVDRLYVTVSGPLADLPLDMLVTEPPGANANGRDLNDLSSIRWLGDRYAMIRLPTVSALNSAARPAKQARASFLGYGAPVTAPASDRERFAFLLSPSFDGDTRSGDRARLASLEALPGTEIELRAMAKLLQAPAQSVVIGPAATEAAVKRDKRVATVSVLAFATHGLLPNELNGRNEPALVMTPSVSADETDDGLFTASEASRLSISAEWVILSACNTASSEGGTDSLSALSRSFLYAGARGLLASHWRVSDDATAALTVETIAAGRRDPQLGHAAARQRAMRAVRTGRREDGSQVWGWTAAWRHPAAWAPFSLIAASDS